jgi:hypothetical protein
MLRKTIKNIALLDLQNFTAEALREIKKIESCAMLLIPKNASDEWKNAYAKITIRNVASIIEVSYSKYSVLNGFSSRSGCPKVNLSTGRITCSGTVRIKVFDMKLT